MRLARAILLLTAGCVFMSGAAEAKTRHRTHARRHALQVTVQPRHGMSALARVQARERQARELPQVASAQPARPDLRFGAFKRDYSLDVHRPAIRPDQDGAVGMSVRLKTHD